MHILWINDDASLAGGCERYIFSTVQELRSRGIRSSVLYKPLKNADPSYLKAFDGAFPKVDLANQLAQLRPDLIYVHQLESVEALATIRQSGVPSIRFFHDH